MAILNYTTTVDAFKTVSEIEQILVKHGAMSIMKQYNGTEIIGLSFLINSAAGTTIPIKMPIKTKECLEILKREKAKGTKNIKATKEQAERVAWRILKDWTEAQMALLDINMVKLEEIFLPYIEIESGKTMFEALEKNNFLLEEK